MASGRITELAERGILAVGGADARDFLHNLLTVDMDDVAGRGVGYGALLTPQGKIFVDLFVVPADAGGSFLIDLRRTGMADFMRRLALYRLRAKVELRDVSAELAVVAGWGADSPAIPGRPVADPRLPALGWRAYLPQAASAALTVPGFLPADAAAYQAHRIALAVPEGDTDYAFGSLYPHDVAMDQLGGVDFAKGCYVGQEIVSRMEHRGTARSRPVTVAATAALPPPGTELRAGERAIGTLGSSAGSMGIAIVRLDRAAAALAAGSPISAGGVPVLLGLPGWAGYSWPKPEAGDG